MAVNNNSTLQNSTQFIVNFKLTGYDLPFAGNQTTIAFYVGTVNTCLMFASCIAGLLTIVVSLKYKKKKFMKWRDVDRFIFYKAMNDVVYYLIQICYVVQVTIEQVNYPVPLLCTIYAVLTNIFGLSQTILTISIAVISFVLVYYNRQLTMGPHDCYLYVIVLFIPTVIFTVVAAFGQLGPNGYFCNFDGVNGRFAHLVIVSIGFSLMICFAAILYILICVTIYKRSKVLEISTGKESLAKKRVLSIAKHSSLLITAFFIQFGVFIIDGIWHVTEIPPVWIHFFVTIVSSCGGVANGVVFYVIMKQKNGTVSPAEQARNNIESSRSVVLLSNSRIDDDD